MLFVECFSALRPAGSFSLSHFRFPPIPSSRPLVRPIGTNSRPPRALVDVRARVLCKPFALTATCSSLQNYSVANCGPVAISAGSAGVLRTAAPRRSVFYLAVVGGCELRNCREFCGIRGAQRIAALCGSDLCRAITEGCDERSFRHFRGLLEGPAHGGCAGIRLRYCRLWVANCETVATLARSSADAPPETPRKRRAGFSEQGGWGYGEPEEVEEDGKVDVGEEKPSDQWGIGQGGRGRGTVGARGRAPSSSPSSSGGAA